MIKTHNPLSLILPTPDQENQFTENLFVTFGSVFDEEALIEESFKARW